MAERRSLRGASSFCFLIIFHSLCEIHRHADRVASYPRPWRCNGSYQWHGNPDIDFSFKQARPGHRDLCRRGLRGAFCGAVCRRGSHSPFHVEKYLRGNSPIRADFDLRYSEQVERRVGWHREEGFDSVGSLLYGFAILTLVYGASRLPDKVAYGFVVLALLALVAFTKQETRVKHPVFEIRLFQTNKLFTFSSLAALINYAATFAVTFLLSLYLQYVKGMNP